MTSNCTTVQQVPLQTMVGHVQSTADALSFSNSTVQATTPKQRLDIVLKVVLEVMNEAQYNTSVAFATKVFRENFQALDASPGAADRYASISSVVTCNTWFASQYAAATAALSNKTQPSNAGELLTLFMHASPTPSHSGSKHSKSSSSMVQVGPLHLSMGALVGIGAGVLAVAVAGTVFIVVRHTSTRSS